MSCIGNMSGVVRLLLTVYLLAFPGVTLAEPKPLVAAVISVGCIKFNEISTCANRPETVYIPHTGVLYAGFPPYNLPDYTYPLCRVTYDIPDYWTDVRFHVSDWCLRGLDESKIIVCCDRTKTYQGEKIESPYFLKHEGSQSSPGGHRTTWDQAFPKSLSMDTLPPYNDAFASDSWGTLNTGQHTEALVPGSHDDAVAADTTFNLNNNLDPNPVQPVVLGASSGQNSDIGQGNAPFYAGFQTAELTAPEPGADIVGV